MKINTPSLHPLHIVTILASMGITITNPSPAMQTVLEQVNAFNAMDVEGILATVTDDIQWITLPKNYVSAGTRGKEEMRGLLDAFINVVGLSAFKVC